TDLIEIARVRRSLERYERFRDRCFTAEEQAYCDSRPNPAQSYAGRFAGKEAVGKALGFGVARAFAWKDIEIVGRPKPSVQLSGRWTVVCGGGSNGGDGRIAARHLDAAGKEVRIVDAKAGETELGDPEVIVDALFGTGFSGEPRPDAAALIEQINNAHARVFAIDLPSGVDASTGEIAGAAVNADATVTFHGRKVGLVVAPGRFHAGEISVVDIGLEPIETAHRLVGADLLRRVPRRGERDNKYTAGH